MTPEAELVKQVFSNPQGEELILLWTQRVLLKKVSRETSSEMRWVVEGERNFVIDIINVIEEAENERKRSAERGKSKPKR